MGRCWHALKMSENDSECSLRFASRLHEPRLNGECWTTTAGVFLASVAFVTSPVRVLVLHECRMSTYRLISLSL